MNRIFTIVMALGLAACGSSGTVVVHEPAQPSKQPAERQILVCVVDPVAPGGTMNIRAIHVLSTHDTLVLQSKGRVPIRKVVTGTKVLSDAKWYHKDQHLELHGNSGAMRFAPVGAPRAVKPAYISLLGFYRGVPIYASAADVNPVRPELESIAARGGDLNHALRSRAHLRSRLEGVKHVYVPTRLVGCVFQQMARTTPKKIQLADDDRDSDSDSDDRDSKAGYVKGSKPKNGDGDSDDDNKTSKGKSDDRDSDSGDGDSKARKGKSNDRDSDSDSDDSDSDSDDRDSDGEKKDEKKVSRRPPK